MANIISQRLNQIKNYIFPTPDNPIAGKVGDWRNIKNPERNLRSYITPVQLQRIRTDVQLWREAVAEAEQAWYPHRVRMQRMYLDTVLNGHVSACMSRRKNLTLLKDFKLCNEVGEENEAATKLLKKSWFGLYCNYVLDAQFFGYSLISLGDLVNDAFPELTTIRRFNISPDRENVTSYVYSLSGAQFKEDPYRLWNVWVPTPTEVGISLVGYGLLYKAAMYEIICRNTLGFNTDAAELYGMPIRMGKTNKTNEDERGLFEAALSNMGSAGYILLDAMDDLELVESGVGGNGHKIYESLETRCEKKISKILLGHADALDSTSGKLGATQGEDSPVSQALTDIQSIDVRFLENNVNTELLPRLREMGIAIPEGLSFVIKNDEEREAMRRREDESNKITADIAQVMKNAGLQMAPEYFEERTGIPTQAVPMAAAPAPPEVKGITNQIKNRLNELYR
jgi:hypothetical protein